MPKRTTTFQMIVHFLRLHWAAPGVTITESKLIVDSRGFEREVDVVIEGEFDGEPVVTSIEVIEHARPADIRWVDGMVTKHGYLPTNRLVLASKSGFTRNALKAVASEGGRVQAITPKVVEVEGESVIKSIWVDQIQLDPSHCRMQLLLPDGGTIVVDAGADYSIFDAERKELGSALELAVETLNLGWISKAFLVQAHQEPERDELKGFIIGFPISPCGYHLHEDALDELRSIYHITLEGDFVFEQSEVAFEMAELAGRRYGTGEATFFGRPTVWVGTTDEESQTTKISVRTKDDKPLLPHQVEGPSTRMQFPELLEIAPPDTWRQVDVANLD